MTSRKPRIEPPPPVPQPKSIPYPPASIWKGKEEGVSFNFRGNVFARRGNYVVQVLESNVAATAPVADAPSAEAPSPE